MIEKFDDTVLTRSDFDNALVVMANTIARKQTKWNVREVKLFLSALSKIKNRDNENWVTLKKSDIIKKLEMDPRDTNKLRKLFQDVAEKSWVRFNGPTEDDWEDGFLITKAKSTRNTVSLQFAKEYLPLLDQLENHFTMFQLDNIAHLKSKYAIILFQNLKSWYNPEAMINHKIYSLDEIKKMFELEDDAYVVTDKKTGKVKFHVYNFEKRVINKAIEEINDNPVKSGMFIHGFVKLKTHGNSGFVTGYDFAFSLVKSDGTSRYDQEDQRDKKAKSSIEQQPTSKFYDVD